MFINRNGFDYILKASILSTIIASALLVPISNKEENLNTKTLCYKTCLELNNDNVEKTSSICNYCRLLSKKHENIQQTKAIGEIDEDELTEMPLTQDEIDAILSKDNFEFNFIEEFDYAELSNDKLKEMIENIVRNFSYIDEEKFNKKLNDLNRNIGIIQNGFEMNLSSIKNEMSQYRLEANISNDKVELRIKKFEKNLNKLSDKIEKLEKSVHTVSEAFQNYTNYLQEIDAKIKRLESRVNKKIDSEISKMEKSNKANENEMRKALNELNNVNDFVKLINEKLNQVENKIETIKLNYTCTPSNKVNKKVVTRTISKKSSKSHEELTCKQSVINYFKGYFKNSNEISKKVKYADATPEIKVKQDKNVKKVQHTENLKSNKLIKFIKIDKTAKRYYVQILLVKNKLSTEIYASNDGLIYYDNFIIAHETKKSKIELTNSKVLTKKITRDYVSYAIESRCLSVCHKPEIKKNILKQKKISLSNSNNSNASQVLDLNKCLKSYDQYVYDMNLNNLCIKQKLDAKKTTIQTPINERILIKIDKKCNYKNYIIKNVFLNISNSKIDNIQVASIIKPKIIPPSNLIKETKCLSNSIFDNYIRDKGTCSNPNLKTDDKIIDVAVKNEIELKEIKETSDSSKAPDSNVKNEDKSKPDTPIAKKEEFLEAKKDINKPQKEEIVKKEIKCKTKFQTGNQI